MARRTRTSRGRPSRREHTTTDAFTVAIVGRPNVGKSTLFNRLVGRKIAIVHDRPGVTRDRRIGAGTIGDLAFTVIDTAGFEDAKADDSMAGGMRRQTEKAVADADVVLFVVDARAGITPLDEHFGDLLRKGRAPVVLVANKAEGKGVVEETLLDAYRLGLGDALAISAEHGEGLDGLYRALLPHAPPELRESLESDEDDDDVAPAEGDETEDAGPAHPLQLAIVGRPNSGKSTLINRLLGEERVLTGPEPGVTRDAIYIDWTYEGQKFKLVDTAGVRRRAKITDAVEKLMVNETFEAIRLAEVVVLVVDAESPLDNQEMTLARHAAEEGRALIIAVNKWDLVKNRNEVLAEMKTRLLDSFAQVRGVSLVTMSAKNGSGIEGLMKAVAKAYRVWNTHVSTAALNRWLSQMTGAHPPPLSIHKQRIKLRYISQAKARPPTFVIFSTRATDLPDAYMRYLTNGLRDSFGLDGTPIRINLRKPKNPFADDK